MSCVRAYPSRREELDMYERDIVDMGKRTVLFV